MLDNQEKELVAKVVENHNRKVYAKMSDFQLGNELQKELELRTKYVTELGGKVSSLNTEHHFYTYNSKVRFKNLLTDCESRISLIEQEMKNRDLEFSEPCKN